MKKNIALSFQNVQKRYGDFTALHGISLEITSGEFFALLGPNGAGKTTLINCLGGILRRSEGSILVDGHDPEIASEITKTKVGIVQQEISFDPFFSALELLRIQRGLFGMKPDEKYIEWLLKKLSLWDKRDSTGRQLSGGMKRRLMIAKALVHKPSILILDEPTAGVDVELRDHLWTFLQELREKEKITIILTTHYLEEAEALAERIAIINAGKIVLCEETKKLLKRQKREVHLTFQDKSTKTILLGYQENIGDILTREKNISDISVREPKLEDIFREVTR